MPRIHRGEIVSRRAVGPRWHDAVAYTIVSVIDNDNEVFLEASLEVTSHASARAFVLAKQRLAAGLPAFVYLRRAGKQRF
jgi:hypothetical protein